MNEAAGRLAGSDTREAAATPTVRLIAGGAFFASGPAWAATFGVLPAWERWLSLESAIGIAPVVLLVVLGVASAILAWRSGPPEKSVLPAGALPLGVVAMIAGAVVVTGDKRVASITMPVLTILGGWFAGRAARIAAAACVAGVTPAAGGIVTMATILGLAFAGPLVAVTDGSGLRWGAGWTLVLTVLAALNLLRAHRSLSTDRRRSEARVISVAPKDVRDLSKFVCEGVEVRFGATKVLKGADLKAGRGELIALVGANGAGKSTLLRVAAGFVPCNSGHVRLAGSDVSMLRPEERASMGLAFVSGARPIFPDLTVLENLRVAAFRSHGGRSFEAATEAIFELAPALEARRRSKAGVLSGGEQRLLAVAQTLFQRPIALLADELSLGLDLDARVAVLDLLRSLADDGVAVVAVDHDLPSLLPRSDRAVLLSDGVAQSFDDPVGLLDLRADLLPATFLAEVPR